MWKKKKSLRSLPEGYQIYERLLKVVGIQYREDAAHRFARCSRQAIKLDLESSNKHDPIAIKVIGISGWSIFKSRRFVGYIPNEVSKQILGSELWGSIKPRLLRIFTSSTGKVYIEFQIAGPKDKKQQYDDFLMNKPATRKQREFLEYFGREKPKGITIGQAEELIKETRRKMKLKNSETLEN